MYHFCSSKSIGQSADADNVKMVKHRSVIQTGWYIITMMLSDYTHTAVLFCIINQCTSCSLPLSRGKKYSECCMWMKVMTDTHMIIYCVFTIRITEMHPSLLTIHVHSVCPLTPEKSIRTMESMDKHIPSPCDGSVGRHSATTSLTL